MVDNRPRKITPREAARIQGFPDWFKVHPTDTAAFKQFGNAVAVPVIKEVLVDFLSNNFLNEEVVLEQPVSAIEVLPQA